MLEGGWKKMCWDPMNAMLGATKRSERQPLTVALQPSDSGFRLQRSRLSHRKPGPSMGRQVSIAQRKRRFDDQIIRHRRHHVLGSDRERGEAP